MRRVRELDELRDEFWRHLVDAISMRHGYGSIEPTFSEVARGLSPKEWAAARIVAKIDDRPMGRVVADAITWAFPSAEPDSEAEAERIWEIELVHIEAALRVPELEGQTV